MYSTMLAGGKSAQAGFDAQNQKIMCTDAFREGNDPGDELTVTYRELLQRVCQFANVLKAQGELQLSSTLTPPPSSPPGEEALTTAASNVTLFLLCVQV